MISKSHIPYDRVRIEAFCRKWGVDELSLFGSILREDFRANSDVDVLVLLTPGRFPEIDEWEAMKVELGKIFGRSVDLISKRGLTNPFLRHQILTNREIVYAA